MLILVKQKPRVVTQPGPLLQTQAAGICSPQERLATVHSTGYCHMHTLSFLFQLPPSPPAEYATMPALPPRPDG